MEKRIKEIVDEFELNWREARIVAGKNYMFDDPAFLEKVKKSLLVSLLSVRNECKEIINKWKNDGENPTETDLVLENILKDLV
jgi:hypothetical protein